MSGVSRAYWELRGLTGHQRILLLALAELARRGAMGERTCLLERVQLRAMVCRGERSIRNDLALLARAGAIRREGFLVIELTPERYSGPASIWKMRHARE